MGGFLSYECCMCGHYVQPDEYMTCPHSKRTTAKLVELKEIEQQLPATFYAGLPLVQRVKMLADHWRRALQINAILTEQLEAQYEKAKADQVESHGDPQERAQTDAPADKEARG